MQHNTVTPTQQPDKRWQQCKSTSKAYRMICGQVYWQEYSPKIWPKT